MRLLGLAFGLGSGSRRRREHLRIELLADALIMTIGRRIPEPRLLHHSDQGSQHGRDDYRRLLAAHGIAYDLEGADCCSSFYLMHFSSKRTRRVGIHLPAVDFWAIVERDDYAMYLILEPMVNDWPQFIYTFGTRHEGIPIEDVIDEACPFPSRSVVTARANRTNGARSLGPRTRKHSPGRGTTFHCVATNPRTT